MTRYGLGQPPPPHSAALSRSVVLDGERLATLVPISQHFCPRDGMPAADRSFCLSRFAYLHAHQGEMVLESPRSHARVHLHDARAGALVHRLSRPARAEELAAALPGVPVAVVTELLTLLFSAGMAGEANEQGECADDDAASLRSWEFHDLLFHARSRLGRHNAPIGGTYRFVGELAPPPALKPVPAGAGIELYRPDMARIERDDPPLAAVQEARRSIREYGARPIHVDQLGEFLYRVGRVADFWEYEARIGEQSVLVQSAPRPYPAGGSLYELEIYPVIQCCDGVAPGLYHYDPERHCLHPIAPWNEDVAMLVKGAGWSTRIPAGQLQVLLVLGARFQRVAWKYASIAYSLTLKHVGVLYQTMYLVATAMGLAPCGVGCGDSDLFARAAGIDYYTESSVGEFLLGSKS